MDYRNPYNRIQFYYTFLRDEPYDDGPGGLSMQRMHEITGIPILTVRKDILEIFRWQSSLSRHIQKLKEDPVSDTGANFETKDSSVSKSMQKNVMLDEVELKFNREDSHYFEILSAIRDSNLADKASYSSGTKDSGYMDELWDALEIEMFEADVQEREKFWKKFEALLLEGKLDQIPITTSDPFYHLSVSQEEFFALQSLEIQRAGIHYDIVHTAMAYGNSEFPFWIKDSIFYTHQYADLNKYLGIINIAIENVRCLSISYKTSAGKNKRIDLRPLKISYDADENLYSLLTVKNGHIQVYRLDLITSITECRKCLPDEDTGLIDAIYPNVWGNCFSDDPVKVKVRFYDEANVWEKVRKNLANRCNGRLYTSNGFLYYEDIVYGISKFRSWIYGFGGSVIVLEPESLRREIIRSLEARLLEE